MTSSGVRRRLSADRFAAEFDALFVDSERWLVARVSRYARDHGFAGDTSTLEEAWRISIRGLSHSLVLAMRSPACDLEIECRGDYTRDPAALFGVVEARKHRERGVTLPMFLGLFKYYRRAYLDLFVEHTADAERRQFAHEFINRYFDRAELGFVGEWDAGGAETRLVELQRANRSMTNEKNRYLTVFESIQFPAILLDEEACVENLNEAAARLFGFGDVSGSSYYSKVAVGLPFTPLAGPIADFFDGGAAEHVCEQSLDTNSGQRHFLVTIKRMMDVSSRSAGAVLVLADITVREDALGAARENWEMYHRLFENMPAGFASHLMVFDDEGVPLDYVFLEVNPAFERLTGLTRDEVAGRRMTEILPGNRQGEFDWVAAYGEVVLSGVPQTFTQYSPPLDAWFDVGAFPIGGNGFACVFSDVTLVHEHATRLERTVVERTAELLGANERLEHASRAKTEFLSKMSHELRTPLNSIIGFSGILLQGLAGDLTDEQLKQVGMIRTSGQHLLELVNGILDLSRIESGRVELHLEDLELGEVVARVAGIMQPLSRAKHLKLGVVVPDAPILVQSDRDKIAQVLLNLVANAIKFTEQGGVSIVVEQEDDIARISVSDTGPGIDAAEIPHLFEEFHRLGRVDRRAGSPEGHGLGLAITGKLVELLGGSIRLQTELDEGSTFVVELPTTRSST